MKLGRSLLLPVFALTVSIAGAQRSNTPALPTLSCGSITENGLVIAVAGDPGHPDNSATSTNTIQLSNGATSLPSLHKDWNGDGNGSADLNSVSANCTLVPPGVTNATVSVNITAQLSARAADCCGGHNGGGVVNFSPQWTAVFNLPPPEAGNHWLIRLSFDAVKSGVHPGCQWTMNGAKQADLPVSTSYDTSSGPVPPGNYAINVSCTADNYHVDARPPGGWGHVANATDTIKMTWTAVQLDSKTRY